LTPADVIVNRIALLRQRLEERLNYEAMIARGEQPQLDPMAEVMPIAETPTLEPIPDTVDTPGSEETIRSALKAGLAIKTISSVHNVAPQEVRRIAAEMASEKGEV
jgi:hypothetical protein